MSSLPLPILPLFHGPVADAREPARLGKQMQAVMRLMEDGIERTAGEVAAVIGCTTSAASARCRDLYKEWPEGPGWEVKKGWRGKERTYRKV